MKPFCASILPLLVTLMLACSNTQSPTSSTTTTAVSASFANASTGTVFAVTRTDESDNGVDGTVDSRTVLTTWYDSHGNPTKEVFERSLPPQHAVRTTTVSEYNSRGARLRAVFESDDGADGTVEFRSTLQTVATNKRGDPIEQSSTSNPVNVFNEFDARGRVIRSVQGGFTTTYGYDSHDNLVLYRTEISQGGGVRTTTLEYNVHDAFVHEEQVLLLNGVARDVFVISTTAYDANGYPVRQLIEGNGFIGSVQGATATDAITYDAHHNKLTQVEYADYDGDGSIDSQGISRWEYQGRSDVPFRQAAPAAASLDPAGQEARGTGGGELHARNGGVPQARLGW